MNHSHRPHVAPSTSPRLFPDLCLSLAVLYSLPTNGGATPITPAQAHEYLLWIQSRNVRRKLDSMQQQRRDQQQHPESKQKKHASSPRQQPSEETTLLCMGSSWLACLALFFCDQKGHTERLFAAQTLLHRCRRVKLVQAIDLELEQVPDNMDPTNLIIQQHPQQNLEWVTSYLHWMQSVNPFVYAVLSSYQVSASLTEQDEERLKGELTLLTLAGILYMTACAPQGDPQTQPLLSTLAETMATVALRLRYSPLSVQQHNGAAHSQPLVTLLTQSLSLVWTTVEASGHGHPAALDLSLYTCLAALPDAVMASPGGARGRLSLDPRCLQAAANELRSTGLVQLWEILQQQQNRPSNGTATDLWMVTTCERWAKFIPLPAEVLEFILPLVKAYLADPHSSQHHHSRAALLFLIAVFESGAWTMDQVLASHLCLSETQQIQQEGKRRQSSRSKRRQKEVLDQNSNDDSLLQAQKEVQHRGEMACRTIRLTWNELMASARSSLAADAIDGEGPIGCLTAAANACLPHLIRNMSTVQDAELFETISLAFFEICNSPQRAVRCLAFEPLYTLHSAIVDVVRTSDSALDPSFEIVIADHFVKCSMALASLCAYPPHYFDNLMENSDEDLEIERNDVRDLLRTIAGSGDGASSAAPLSVPSTILLKLLRGCDEAVSDAHRRQELVSETVAHAFSSLAKPLNQIGRFYDESHRDESFRHLLRLALKFVNDVGTMLVESFQSRASTAYHLLFTVSRLLNVAVGSLSPMLASISSHQQLQEELGAAISISVQAASFSIRFFPELAAPSTLDSTQYDIRGAYRLPGGEDHVGCLALMRLTTESPQLTALVKTLSEPFFIELCELYLYLKSVEGLAGRNQFHGKGVLPKSRRILLAVLCTLAEGEHIPVFADLLSSAVAKIESLGCDSEALFEMTECVLDISHLSPQAVSSQFSGASPWLSVLTRRVSEGYSARGRSKDEIFQWNRLRAAVYSMLKVAVVPEFLRNAGEMISALVFAECEAVHSHCLAGPTSQSEIFVDDAISPDCVPAGLYIMVIDEAMNSLASTDICVQTLCSVKDPVLAVVLSPCSDPVSFVDPRPHICEAWCQVLNKLCSNVLKGTVGSDDGSLKSLLVDSASAIIMLLLNPTMARTREERAKDCGMNVDTAASLSMLDFLVSFFDLGPVTFHLLANYLRETLPVDAHSIQELSDGADVIGYAIVGAALFRAVQGSLPPWAVETIPELYRSLYVAVNRDPRQFEILLQSAMNVRLERSFGGVQPGLLAERMFENDAAAQTCVSQCVARAKEDNVESWRKLKVLVKKACGGKKKDSDFNQKPQMTRWEFDRI